ncbi:MAG TPA: thiamine diphosphokinase, partial [Bacteroidetes bacterium]|nr:thiamine diphosphokinase [Bacteroidota bacterium]
MKALIIANGNLPARELYKTYLHQAELILCADGGANLAFAASINPDFVVGDLDSIEDVNKRKLGENRIIHRPGQNATDLEKTLQFALEKGVTSAVVIGITGGRTDHQVGNLNILQKFAAKMEMHTIDKSDERGF